MLRANSAFYFKLSVVLLLLSLLIYGGTSDHQLLNWDDRSYTVENPWVTNPNLSNLVAMFTEVRMANWHPLTWLSFVPEYAFCDDFALCYKIDNSILHALNALLVAMLATVIVNVVQSGRELPIEVRKLMTTTRLGLSFGQWVGVFSGLLFLAHPQHVESVTWVAERKDLLCAFFYLLALISYCLNKSENYVLRYGLTYLFFVFSLMSKSMAVSLPLALVLFDVCLLHYEEIVHQKKPGLALRRLLIEKLPFFLTMFAAMLLTLLSQTPGRLESVTLVQKISTIAAGLQHYLISFVWPVEFSPFYPQELVYTGLVNLVPGLLFLIVTTLILLRYRTHWSMPLIVLSLLFFLVSVAPVSGLVKIGEQAYADRYSYIPTMGLFVVAAWILATWIVRITHVAMVLAPSTLLLVFVSLQSYAYKSVWRDDLVFWTTVVNKYPDLSSTPLNNLANSYAERGDYELAAEFYRRSIFADSGGIEAYLNLASIYDYLGNSPAALQTLETGVQANPESAGLHSRAGRAFLLAGDLNKASRYIQQANELQPDLADVQLSSGMLYMMRGDLGEAIVSLGSIPTSMPQHYEAGLLLVQIQAQEDPDLARQTLSGLFGQYGEREQLVELREALASQ